MNTRSSVVLFTFNNKEWDGRVEALFEAIGGVRASGLGVQLQDRKLSALGEGANYLLPTHTTSAAGSRSDRSRWAFHVLCDMASRPSAGGC